MKRFIDLRGQIYCDNDLPVGEQHPEFAWFDTRVSDFEKFDDGVTFDSWEEFESYYTTAIERGEAHAEIERYKRLCPEWVFTALEKRS